MWAVVPFKGAVGAKSRLASVFSDGERERLAIAMLEDVLGSLTGSSLLNGVILSSRSHLGAELASRYGVQHYADHASNLSDAVCEASQYAVDVLGAHSTFIVPGDVPLITSQDVDEVLADHSEVTIVPDRHRLGTNGIVSTPPNAFPYLFDGRSFVPHQQAARQNGLSVRVFYCESFGLDVDSVRDAQIVLDAKSVTHTGKFLQSVRDRIQGIDCQLDSVALHGS